MDREPTFRQLELVRLIYNYTKRNGYAPSRREIARMMGVASLNAITDMLKAIYKKGLAVSVPNCARSLQVTEAGQRAIGVIV